MSKILTTLMLLVSLFAAASSKDQIRALDSNDLISKLNDSLLYPVDSGAEGVQQMVAFTVSHHGEKLFTEIYLFSGLDSKELTVLPVRLGGAAQGRDSGAFLKGDLVDFTVSVSVNGEPAETLTATQFLEQDVILRDEDIAVLKIDAVEMGEKTEAEIAENESVAAKAAFQCPNTIPYCDDAHDRCEERCDYGDPYCLQTCGRKESECYVGRTVGRWTEQETLAQNFSFQDCRWYPWYNISPKLWNVYYMTFRKTEYERRYCETVGQTYTVKVRTWTETDTCYQNTGQPCSLDGSSYLGGACKL